MEDGRIGIRFKDANEPGFHKDKMLVMDREAFDRWLVGMVQWWEQEKADPLIWRGRMPL